MKKDRISLHHIFKAGSQYVAIDASRRVFIGEPGKMQQAAVLAFNVYRDGGTMRIHTDKGQIYVPGAFSRGTQASFNNAVMTRLDAKDEKLVKSLKIKDIKAYKYQDPDSSPR